MYRSAALRQWRMVSGMSRQCDRSETLALMHVDRGTLLSPEGAMLEPKHLQRQHDQALEQFSSHHRFRIWEYAPATHHSVGLGKARCYER